MVAACRSIPLPAVLLDPSSANDEACVRDRSSKAGTEVRQVTSFHPNLAWRRTS